MISRSSRLRNRTRSRTRNREATLIRNGDGELSLGQITEVLAALVDPLDADILNFLDDKDFLAGLLVPLFEENDDFLKFGEDEAGYTVDDVIEALYSLREYVKAEKASFDEIVQIPEEFEYSTYISAGIGSSSIIFMENEFVVSIVKRFFTE